MPKPKVLAASFILLIAVLAGGLAGAARAGSLSEDDRKAYRAAFAAADKEKWGEARAWARKAHDKLLAKTLRWMEYVNPRSDASFQEISEFAHDNPDWPQPNALARRAEDALGLTEPNEALLAWFIEHPPITPNGKMAWARALSGTGREDKATAVIRDAWVNDVFGSTQESQFLKLHGHRLRKEDHLARLDRLLWDQRFDHAGRMLSRVDPGHRSLAQARMLLAGQRAGAEGAVAKVPAELRNDPGLRFERVRWRRKKELYIDAAALLPGNGGDKGSPQLWWKERSVLARELLRMGHVSQAYDAARTHGPLEGAQLAEAEWLAGWIALRSLREKGAALKHFKRAFDGVASPMSRSRGAYWAGRASEEMGDKAESEKWYRIAADHLTSYYGQLAAERLGGGRPWSLPDDPVPTKEDLADFGRGELVRVVEMLAEVGARDQIRPFVLRLVELARTPGQHVLAVKLAARDGRPDTTVAAARRAAQKGVALIEAGFPVIDEASGELPEKALVLSVIRQESNFLPAAVSSAGALGLMQLLPGTAQQMAKSLDLPFAKQRLTQDPKYNVRLGTAFLGHLIGSFEGSYVLAIAAYNAGPARARQWVREFGDPRQPDIDAIDWVETIPYSETRNYVQRVLECLQVYRRRLDAAQVGQSLENDIKRRSDLSFRGAGEG